MKGMEVLNVKLSSKTTLEVFKHLDQGMKGYIVYSEFCNLCDERRLKIDPALVLQDEVMQVKGGKRGVMSPMIREQERRHSLNIFSPRKTIDTKTELRHYLNAMNLDDLEKLTSQRRSTKNL